MNIEKPLFIVFEGIDGSGKTTQINLLKDKFEETQRKAAIESEPTNGEIGILIQKILKGGLEIDEPSISALFLADRLNHINKPNGLKQKLSQGFNVICSRYYFSNYAFQSENVPFQWLVDCNSLCKTYLKPDIIFYLDVDPLKCYERIIKRGKDIEIYENSKKLERTHRKYLQAFNHFANEENIFIINGDKKMEDINKKIWELTLNEIKLKNFQT